MRKITFEDYKTAIDAGVSGNAKKFLLFIYSKEELKDFFGENYVIVSKPFLREVDLILNARHEDYFVLEDGVEVKVSDSEKFKLNSEQLINNINIMFGNC